MPPLATSSSVMIAVAFDLMRADHFRPNKGSFFRGSTYTWSDLYTCMYGKSVGLMWHQNHVGTVTDQGAVCCDIIQCSIIMRSGSAPFYSSVNRPMVQSFSDSVKRQLQVSWSRCDFEMQLEQWMVQQCRQRRCDVTNLHSCLYFKWQIVPNRWSKDRKCTVSKLAACVQTVMVAMIDDDMRRLHSGSAAVKLTGLQRYGWHCWWKTWCIILALSRMMLVWILLYYVLL